MNKKIIISKLEEVLKAQLIIGNEEIRVLSLTVSDSLVNLKKNQWWGFLSSVLLVQVCSDSTRIFRFDLIFNSWGFVFG